jgi:sulfate permease, SulP family
LLLREESKVGHAVLRVTGRVARLRATPTLTLALLGAIESLLCARVADQISGQPRHDPNRSRAR